MSSCWQQYGSNSKVHNGSAQLRPYLLYAYGIKDFLPSYLDGVVTLTSHGWRQPYGNQLNSLGKKEKKQSSRNGESMAELGHSFVSADKNSQRGSNADPGAGANAVSVDDMMFVANSSLYELVWSPRKGLGVKCADCSLGNRNSILWCSESGNMIIQPSQSIKGKEVESNGAVNEEKLSAPNPENKICITETLVEGIMPLSGTGSNKDNLKVESNKEDELLKKEMDMHSISDTHKDADVNEKRTSSIVALHDIASAQDPDNVRSVNSSPNKLEIGEFTKGVSSNEKGEDIDIQAASPADILVSEVSKIKQYNLTERSILTRSPNVKHGEPVYAFEEASEYKLSALEKRESTAENDIKPLKTENKLCYGSVCAQVGVIVASQPESEGKHNSENKAMLIEASLNEKGNSLKQRKGKEKAYSDTESNRSFSREEESFESSNSGQLFSKGRRGGKFEHRLVVGNKKIKRHQNEMPCSASFIGQDSSFMNWISTMVKGLSKFDSDNTPCLALPAKPIHYRHGRHDSLSVSHDKIQEDTVGRSTGFQNIFQALYFPYFPRERSENKINQQTEAEGSKELKVANKMPRDDASTRTASSEDKYKFIHAGMSIPPNVSSDRITSAEENPINACNMACDTDQNKCFNLAIIHGSSEEKGAIIHGSTDQNKCSDFAADKSPLENLWITRFSPKVSMPMLNSEQCHQDKGAIVERITDSNKFLPLSQQLSVSIRDKNNLEDGREPSHKDQTNAASRSVRYCSVSPTGSCDSMKTKVQSCQKFKSKLSPILPSQRFKSSKPMASVFARRLDAIKHITPPIVTDNASHAAILCFHCGKRGHFLRDCSEIIESEFMDLLKDEKLYDRFEGESCLCIRCLQFGHWAVSCPYSSSRKQTWKYGNASFHGDENSERRQREPQIKNPLVGICSISQGENSRLNAMVCTDKVNGTTTLNGRTSDYKPVKRGLLGEDCHKGMSWKGTSCQVALNGGNAPSTFMGNEVEENQLMPYVNKQISSIPREAFEIIRRLRLSRADILKWMKSPDSNFSLEGFFLRLRLGKWEEGLGATGYHVACISGAHRESSSGKCQLPISVDVGGLKCAVGCRYVSNHDFTEDELEAWWCENSKGAGKLPRLEELNMKLLEKEEYGL